MKIESSNINKEGANWSKKYREIIEEMRIRAKREGVNPDKVVREFIEEAQRSLMSEEALSETTKDIQSRLSH
jgi:hypothetical protein